MLARQVINGQGSYVRNALRIKNYRYRGISGLVTKQSKLKLYRTVIRPIVTYSSETWVLKETIIQEQLVFGRRILRRKPNTQS